MNNSSIIVKPVDSDPTSALVMGIWLTIVGLFGIPLNIFIVVATVKVKEIRAASSNAVIGSLALSDALLMFSLSLHLPYALTYNETLCKVIGFGIGMFVNLGHFIPPFLALNRYAVICHQYEKLARRIFKVFSKKGIYWIILILWVFEIFYQLPYVMLDTIGLHNAGFCTTVKKSTNSVYVRMYYYCTLLTVATLSNFPLLIFYRKVSSWIKTMSAKLLVSVDTKQTIRETKNVLLLTKWVTLIPIIFTSPALVFLVLFEFNSEIIPVGVARLIFSSYPFVPLLNAIITLKYAGPYRLSLKKVCDRTKLTSILFSWIIEGRWVYKVDFVKDIPTSTIAARY